MNILEELKIRGLVAQTSNYEKLNEILTKYKICFYIGFDPTAGSLHVGHLVQLLIIKRFQMYGHTAICLFGGGTALIGDPSLKNDMRKMLTEKEVSNNIKNFIKQSLKFVYKEKIEFVNNADWLCDLNYIDFLKDIGIFFSINKMLSAKCYKSRLDNGLTFFELNYMIMQSYDFFVLNKKFNCIIQIGGDDQWSNILSGTELIRKKIGKETFAITTELLTTADGRKMGKTEAGALWLDPKKISPYEFFQYFRNVDDKDVIKFLKTLTLISVEDIKKYEDDFDKNPNEIKEIMAFEITSLVHGCEEASKALETSRNIFDRKSNEGIPETEINFDFSKNNKIKITELIKLSGITKSLSEASRLIEQGGIVINDKKIINNKVEIEKYELENGVILKKGKKKFIRCYIKKL